MPNIQRYYEYTDENGKRVGAIQSAADATRQVMNDHLKHMARVKGWKDIEVFPPEMPEWQVKARINAVQAKNGNEPLFPEEETREPDLRKTIVSFIDHAEPVGGQQQLSSIPPTSPVTIVNPIAGAPTPDIPITEHPAYVAPASPPAPVAAAPQKNG